MPKSARSVTLKASMTHRQVCEVVAAVWPAVVLSLYRGTGAYYHQGSPFAKDSWIGDDEIVRPDVDPAGSRAYGGPVEITGTMTLLERRDVIYRAFALEPEFECAWLALSYNIGDTLDEMQANAERWVAAYEKKYGKPPGKDERFESVKLPK